MDRRLFLQGSAASASSLVLASGMSATPPPDDPAPTFTSPWHDSPDRVWLGAEFWANPLQDWRVQNGRAECANPAIDRNVHLLTYQLNDTGPDPLPVRPRRPRRRLPPRQRRWLRRLPHRHPGPAQGLPKQPLLQQRPERRPHRRRRPLRRRPPHRASPRLLTSQLAPRSSYA